MTAGRRVLGGAAGWGEVGCIEASPSPVPLEAVQESAPTQARSGRRPPPPRPGCAAQQLSATFYIGSFCADDTHTSGFFLSQGWFVCLVEGRCIGNRKLGYEAKAQLCVH